MKTFAIALALCAALVTPAASSLYSHLPSCTTFTPGDTLNIRSLPNGEIIVGEFITNTPVWILDTKLANGHPWAFVLANIRGTANSGWVYAEYLTRCVSQQ